ncbi:MAG TPA: cytochrome c oxidase assembly protein [Bradyrhizobium sp.]|uniref:cytochrome c oxidase assembly protein n=1 Tax=Bradyrhizobium sp. TaxID=376 RepID=UPI002D7EB87A|nr:cytochrome c oxidase assembly protein [Bradyrhizobium sp.]HET7888344.1 cytochrome c oxidase assembly protein [Bradyrhizobium sp.]
MRFRIGLGAQHAAWPNASLCRLHPAVTFVRAGFLRPHRARITSRMRLLAIGFRHAHGIWLARDASIRRAPQRAICNHVRFRAGSANAGVLGLERMRALGFVTVAFLLHAERASAHAAAEPTQHLPWTFDPWIVTPLAIFAVLYTAGNVALRQRGKRGGSRLWLGCICWAGWLSLATSLISPLHWLGEHLFTFHMIEHEIIMAISAPLLVLANPIGTMLWAFPRSLRVGIGRLMRRNPLRLAWQWLTGRSQATALHGAAIWLWHAPGPFDAAVTNLAIHRLQHLSFFLTAILFWWSVLRRNDAGVAAWQVFMTMLHTSLLGALMALAPRVLYGAQTANAYAFGLTPLQDQQLAGIIMWVPAGTIYAGVALALTAVWIRQVGERTRNSDVVGAT